MAPFSIGGMEAVSPPRPILIKARMKDFEATFPYPMAVFAEATRGEDAVLNLNVTATVDRPYSAETFRFALKDDGLGPDLEKDDGVYSGLFADYDAVGRYSFSVMAENADGSVFDDSDGLLFYYCREMGFGDYETDTIPANQNTSRTRLM